jgi:hypothetical protein
VTVQELSDHAFRFFILISEMKRPQDAMKVFHHMACRIAGILKKSSQAAWCLQGFATTFYTVYCIVNYAYIGNTIQSPNFFSLPPRWAKACFGVAFINFLLYVAPSFFLVCHTTRSTALREFTSTPLRRSYSSDFFDILNTSIRIQYSVGLCGLCCVSAAS